VFSVLFWTPLIRHITKPLERMTRASEKIASGRFDVKIEERRADEIGRLGRAINHMTSRLAGHVKGQKRFLGDVAHELGSPIARIQFGLGVLEQRCDEKNRERVKDVLEDVAHMSNLVNELLSFSRAEISPEKVGRETMELLPIIREAKDRESLPEVEIRVQVPPGLTVCADGKLVTRAVSNLLRNAVRYAGKDGPITVKAWSEKKEAVVRVSDSGPGVDEEILDRLFEPFYRPEPSRNRKSGGAGLGLAIVKTCVDACQGSVAAKNMQPRGFEVSIRLPRKSESN
jgi:two-component system sensor histidine kinase CpxA